MGVTQNIEAAKPAPALVKLPADSSISLGESRVGVSFNPSKFPEVDYVKSTTASAIDKCNEEWADEAHNKCILLIDLCEDACKNINNPEIERCYQIARAHFKATQLSLSERAWKVAQDDLEAGCMWAVKAITKP